MLADNKLAKLGVLAIILGAILVLLIGALKPFYHVKLENKAETISFNPTAAVQWVDILVAGADLPPGAEFKNAPLDRKRYPVSQLPPSAIINQAELAGKWSISSINKGTPITSDLLTEKLLTVSMQPKMGYRGYSINVTKADAVNGNIRPRSRVNVIHTVGRSENITSRVLAENVEVLSVGFKDGRKISGKLPDFINTSPNTALVVTLELSLDQAVLVDLATGQGRLSLALLHPMDGEQTARKDIGVREVLSGSSQSSTVQRECKKSQIVKDGKVIEWGCDEKVNAVVNRGR
jgi:Flp pilus assembly protein CpaB